MVEMNFLAHNGLDESTAVVSETPLERGAEWAAKRVVGMMMASAAKASCPAMEEAEWMTIAHTAWAEIPESGRKDATANAAKFIDKLFTKMYGAPCAPTASASSKPLSGTLAHAVLERMREYKTGTFEYGAGHDPLFGTSDCFCCERMKEWTLQSHMDYVDEVMRTHTAHGLDIYIYRPHVAILLLGGRLPPRISYDFGPPSGREEYLRSSPSQFLVLEGKP